jgi:hypothetical protein
MGGGLARGRTADEHLRRLPPGGERGVPAAFPTLNEFVIFYHVPESNIYRAFNYLVFRHARR